MSKLPFMLWMPSRLKSTIAALKQFTGVERGQYRLEVAQRNHIGLAIRAFVRLEVHRSLSGISWFEAKTGIIRSAMRAYLAHPTLILCSTA